MRKGFSGVQNLGQGNAYEFGLIRVNMPEQRQKRSRPLQVTDIKNFNLVGLGITE